MHVKVRSVSGDLSPNHLGPANYHEHLFQRSPLLPGEDLDELDPAMAEARELADSGFAAMVDATPVGLGRRPRWLAEVAQATGVRIIASTGRHRDEHYRDQEWVLELTETRLSEIFVRELTEGMAVHDGDYADRAPERVRLAESDGRPLRAGAIKAGIGYWRISPAERRALGAAASAHRRTGAPIMVHTERGTAAHEVVDLLAETGVRPGRVALAHVDRNPDPGLHAELAARGAWLGYDGAGRAKDWPDSILIDCLERVISAGHAGRLLLGNDVARRSRFVGYGGLPGMGYLGRRFIPRLRDRLGDPLVDQILHNPARWLTWTIDERAPHAHEGN